MYLGVSMGIQGYLELSCVNEALAGYNRQSNFTFSALVHDILNKIQLSRNDLLVAVSSQTEPSFI